MPLQDLRHLLERLRVELDAKDSVREQALQLSRQITRDSATSIKHVHRGETEEAAKLLKEIRQRVEELRATARLDPDIWHAGFVQDALKEFAEASLVYSFLFSQPIQSPEELGMDTPPYLNGLAEAMGEVRRAILDFLRKGELERVEPLLALMDDVYYLLLTFDYAEALTLGLRRRVDNLRGILERTRGDVTISLQYHRLAKTLVMPMQPDLSDEEEPS